MMISKNPNLTDYSEDASLPAHHRRGCNFWISLIPATKYHKLSTTTTSSPNLTDSSDDLLPTPIQFRCVCNFWNSIHKFARKHFKRSTRSDLSSTNPNINIERSDTSSTNPNIIIDSLPALPFDLIAEILSRLPVKLLLQLRCVCKSWNSLISNDPKFAKKHLTNSTTPNLHTIRYDQLSQRCVLNSQPLRSVSTDIATNFTQLCFPFNVPFGPNLYFIVGSCHGILCLVDFQNLFFVLWNPSIRKFKELPTFHDPNLASSSTYAYGFGYDHLSSDYKVIVLYCSPEVTEVKVYTLTTNSWTTIQTTFTIVCSDQRSGIYVSGTINWLAVTNQQIFILSFDLRKDSCQKILPPEHVVIYWRNLNLSVLRDCLCVMCTITHHQVFPSYHDVWVMKEFGNKESWTKLFKVSFLQNSIMSLTSFSKALYIFEDDQVLLEALKKLIVYDIKNGTFKIIDMFDITPEVCFESLISPCS